MALTLSRFPGESIIINKNIVVTVAQIRGEKVRLTISAPSHIPINRLEVQRAIDSNTKSGQLLNHRTNPPTGEADCEHVGRSAQHPPRTKLTTSQRIQAALEATIVHS